jgi:hypothetical protein
MIRVMKMSSYTNFQSDNKKYESKENRTNIYNPEFNPSVEARGKLETEGFEKNLNKWIDFISWAKWFPDLFFDLITPDKGSIRLDLDQRVYMRAIARFIAIYGVFPRGYGKTFKEVLMMYHTAIFFPDVFLTMTAQTRDNASKLLKEKHSEVIKYYPLIANEIIKSNFSKDSAEIVFTSGGRIDVMANSHNSKGARRHRMSVEEAAQLNDILFQDALQPIVNIPRRTIGKEGVINPEEMNGQICFYTTSWYRGSSEYERSLKMIDAMADLQGVIVLGSDWQLACQYGRGETRSQILTKKSTMSPIAFALNYESRWVGASDNQLVDINKLLNLRTLSKPRFKNDNKGEFILGVDVARSQDSSNNQSSVAVIEIKRNKNNKVTQCMLVNMFTISNSLNFTAQAVEVKKIKRDYEAKMSICDSNGLGVGLIDELMKESFDPNTGESLGCWDSINTDVTPEIRESEKCLYDLKPQSANSDIIVAFMDMVESGKLRLLEKKSESEIDIMDNDSVIKYAPYRQTDELIEEIANLQLKTLSSGKLSIDKVIKKYNKDRVSAIMYALWYIKTFEDNIYDTSDTDLSNFAKSISLNNNNKTYKNSNSLTSKIFR